MRNYARFKPKTTTILVDKKTIDDLKFIERLKKEPIQLIVEKSLEYFRNDYKKVKTLFFAESPEIVIDMKDSILHFAKKLQMDENRLTKTSNKANPFRSIKKSIVIDNHTLACVNKVSKHIQIKRDFIFISAIKHKKDATLKMRKFEKRMAKEFLEKVIFPMQKILWNGSENYINLVTRYMKKNQLDDEGIFTDIDIWGAVSAMESHHALGHDIELFEEHLSRLEDIS